MATKKINKVVKKTKPSKKVVVSTKKRTKEKSKKDLALKESASPKFYDQLKLSESYVSLVLGVVVVFAIFAFGFIYILNSKESVEKQRDLNNKIVPTPEAYVEKYTMKDGESLWDVAVTHYGDGFLWVKIAEANKDVIINPDYVPPGTVIIIPQINK